MRICLDCAFSKKDVVQIAPGQGGMAIFCTHEECRDPVSGDSLPANIARQNVIFCGMPAKFYKKKETIVAPKEEGSNLIQLK